MRLLRSFPILTIALVLLSIVGFCAARGSVELLLVAGTLAALSWYVTEGPRGRTLPKWVSNVLVVAVAVSVIVDLLVPPNEILDVLGRFSIWLTLIKLYERRTARDHAHLMALSLLLMLIGCLTSVSLLFGAVLVAYAALGLYVLLLYQVYAPHERVAAARRGAAEPGAAAAPALRPTLGRHVLLQFRLLAAVIGAAGLVLSSALFVIFPRSVGRGLLSPTLRGPASARVAGYTDRIDLVGGARITDSRRAVGDLALVDRFDRPARFREPLLLRGSALDHYENGRWRAPRGDRAWLETRAGEWTSIDDAVAEQGTVIVQRFRFHRGTATIFGLYQPTGIRTEISHELLHDRVPGALTTGEPDHRLWSYELRSCPSPSVTAAAPPEIAPSLDDWFRQLDLPGPRRIRGQAEALLASAGLPRSPPDPGQPWAWNRRAAEVFAGWLGSDRFRYTLDVSGVVRGAEDPIVEFLFESRQGHCEFFASALAALCRSVGIDARVVAGYVACEYDETQQRYLLFTSNAHAWVEVRTGLHRYAPIDPTPPGVLQPRIVEEGTLASRLGWLYHRLEGAWANRVIGFDDRSQAQLLESMDAGWSERVSEILDSTREWMVRVNQAFYLGPAGYIWMGIVASALLIAAVAAVKVFRRYRGVRRVLRLRRTRVVSSHRLVRQLGFYLDMLHVLDRAGHAKPAWLPPLAWSGALEAASPRGAELVRRIAGVYYGARYGGERLSRGDLAEARQLVEELAACLKARR